MDEYQEIISSYISSLTTTNEKIEALKRRITPSSTRYELKEILDSIIVEDTDYVRRYLKNSCLIIFQKDYVIDSVAKWIYRGAYNNDSEYMALINNAILISFQDYALYSENYSYFTDVFINGVKADPSTYIIRDSYYTHEKFFTGHKRLFLRKTEVSDGDIVSIVVRKYRKFNSYFKAFKVSTLDVSNNRMQYNFYKENVGNFLNRDENLIVYKKRPNTDFYLPMDKNSYSFTISGDLITLNILTEHPVLNTVYLVINKIQHIEYSFENTSPVSKEEYIEHFAVLDVDYVDKTIKIDGAYIPIPADNLDEVEIFVNGYRLVNGYDFNLITNNPNKAQHIHFSGILKQNAKVIFRNKNISDEFGFFKHFPSMETDGVLDLTDVQIPISEDYVEAYVCRKRVPLIQKRSILNRHLKIDSQKSLQLIDTYPEIEWSLLSTEVLIAFRNELGKNVLGQIIDSFTEDVVDYWKDNNELKENEGFVVPYTTESEVFIGHVNSIKINVDSSIVIEGKLPTITVIGFYSEGGDSTSVVGMDVTPYCEISTFDPFEVGRHVITARYVQGNEIFTDSMEIETVYKELISIRIVTESNFYVVDDAVKSTVSVIAKFEDLSEKNVTDLCEIDCPEYAEEAGYITIKVKFNYDGREVTKEKYILVSETSERKITNLDVVLDNYIINDVQTTNMSLYATYTNNMIQKLDKSCVTVYIEEDNDVLTEILDIENSEFIDFTSAIKLRIEAYTKPNKKEKILFVNEDGTTSNFINKKIRIINDIFEDESRYLVYNDLLCSLDEDYIATLPEEYTSYRVKDIQNNIISIGTAFVKDEIICTVIPEDLAIIDFLDADGVLLNQVLFKVKNKNEYRTLVDATIEGNIVQGFTVKISKFLFGKTLEEIDVSNITVLDENYEQLALFNDPSFSKSTDIATEDNTYIYLYFNNFATKSGNVKILAEFIDKETESDREKKMYLDILGCEKLINLEMISTADIIYIPLNLVENCVINRSQEDYYLDINVVLPDGAAARKLYLSKPNNTTLEELEYSTKISLPLQTDLNNSIYVTKNIYGINNYYFYNNLNGVVYLLSLGINELNGRIRITSINRTPITETEYNSIPVVYA